MGSSRLSIDSNDILMEIGGDPWEPEIYLVADGDRLIIYVQFIILLRRYHYILCLKSAGMVLREIQKIIE
jgi:hypothetical protein